ncbi:unnamed protein product [Leuciscus chuanchicus]
MKSKLALDRRGGARVNPRPWASLSQILGLKSCIDPWGEIQREVWVRPSPQSQRATHTFLQPHGTHKDPFWAVLSIAISSQTSNKGDYGIARSPRGRKERQNGVFRGNPLGPSIFSQEITLQFVSLYSAILSDLTRATAAVL